MSLGLGKIDRRDVVADRIPTDRPESGGTLEWDSTTLVAVRVRAGGAMALGYTCASSASAKVVEEELRDSVVGREPMDFNTR